jgi:hypothetical protein
MGQAQALLVGNDREIPGPSSFIFIIYFGRDEICEGETEIITA